ncbi:unknown [Eggerthella sp. CAG:368]|nr:unknown [Eggerthella sp. CAG:368]
MKFARHNLFVAIEIICLCLALMSGCVLGWGSF